MNFYKEDVENALNLLYDAVEKLLNSTHETYQLNIEYFMNLIKENDVINHVIKIIKTSIEKPLESYNFEKNGIPGIILKLPADKNIQIAFILKKFEDSLKNKVPMWKYAIQVFHKASLNENVQLFNDQYVRPCMNEIMNKILRINK